MADQINTQTVTVQVMPAVPVVRPRVHHGFWYWTLFGWWWTLLKIVWWLLMLAFRVTLWLVFFPAGMWASYVHFQNQRDKRARRQAGL